ncbi:hypothetical protein F751_4628 [Auxenochlorella protothecoides]|uniref:Uncharacterized protein n=1 Tax=Auxenochlorella protothecoides TaxID=3075 RepID=A0A087SNQ4_AUXPR|nr:hypothetical protein F751_4628 [Auxenochlorella protothecoides]KFM27358.1 hypothetical protein F751_4628 [Auxenochlorella protothecoides]
MGMPSFCKGVVWSWGIPSLHTGQTMAAAKRTASRPRHADVAVHKSRPQPRGSMSVPLIQSASSAGHQHPCNPIQSPGQRCMPPPPHTHTPFFPPRRTLMAIQESGLMMLPVLFTSSTRLSRWVMCSSAPVSASTSDTFFS